MSAGLQVNLMVHERWGLRHTASRGDGKLRESLCSWA